jgi:hypothetical protein
MMPVSIPVMLFVLPLDWPNGSVPLKLPVAPFPALVPQVHHGRATPSGVDAGAYGSAVGPKAEREFPLPSSDEKSTAGPSPGHCVGVIVRVISRKGGRLSHHALRVRHLGLHLVGGSAEGEPVLSLAKGECSRTLREHT